MYSLIEKYNLFNQLRWIEGQSNKLFNGELYRVIADYKGIFVQPALFEAFGLTVIEAMATGLPTFATQYGGPLEIIEDGKSGFHIDPTDNHSMYKKIMNFFDICENDSDYWKKVSDGAIARVQDKYNWELYARRMLNLSRIYGFWKFVSNLERNEMQSYLDLLFGLVYRPHAMRIENHF